MPSNVHVAIPIISNDAEATCPECQINHIEAPFDYCSMCEMLTSYYGEKLATPEQLQDRKQFNEAYEKWRRLLTWAQIETFRDTYWTKAKRTRVRAARK
jgi:hypothetical protein